LADDLSAIALAAADVLAKSSWREILGENVNQSLRRIAKEEGA
jgi:hypothetical protein